MLYCIFSVQSTYCCLSREVLMKIIGMFSSFTVRCQNISPWQHFVFWNNLCSVLQFNKKSNFFLLGYETECSWVFSLFFLLAHIFMSCFVSGSLWDSLSQAGITAGGEVELVRLRLRQPMAHPQAHWTLCAVWILPVSCSSHCVIGRIMFRDSLFFAPHMFRLSSSVHFSILKMEPGQQAVRLPPSVLQFCWWAGRYYCSSGTDSSEVIIHQLF